jgi:hypothetical protein
MPRVHSYTQAYIASSRQRFDEQLNSYRALVDGSSAPNVGTFEQKFCQAMLLALDNSFANRAMVTDVPGSTVLIDVRDLCNAILTHRNQTVPLTTDKLARLASAFFDALEQTRVAAAA